MLTRPVIRCACGHDWAVVSLLADGLVVFRCLPCWMRSRLMREETE